MKYMSINQAAEMGHYTPGVFRCYAHRIHWKVRAALANVGDSAAQKPEDARIKSGKYIRSKKCDVYWTLFSIYWYL